MLQLEIVVYTIEAALKAQEGGADRIELCADPGAGGTTPSFGTIEVVRRHVSMDVYVMIRPRGGDFHYSSYEFHSMKRDIAQCQRLSVDGVVFGILEQDGRIDKKRCRELIEKARPLKVTCHRAFDCTRDPFEALEDCIEAGFDYILTSGQKPTAIEGMDLIQKLVDKAGGRITIMPGSGINPHNAGEIIKVTGARNLHLSAVTYRRSSMDFFNIDLKKMGSDGSHENDVRTADPEIIRALRNIGAQIVR